MPISNSENLLEKFKSTLSAYTCSTSNENPIQWLYHWRIQLARTKNKILNSTANLSIFHMNIHSLNANCFNLKQMLINLEFNFDIIVLSEIWANNIEFYRDVLTDYTFIYELPVKSNIGGGLGYLYTKIFNM